MAPRTDPAAVVVGRRRTAGVVAVVLALSGIGLAGCGVVSAARKVTNAVESNKAAIDAFTSTIKPSGTATFEATYVTTGSSPETVTYAVKPPKGLSFRVVPSGGGSGAVDLVVNSSGEFACSVTSGSGSAARSGWSCQKLGSANAAAQNKIFDLYTPAHWITFLRDFSLVAGLAGDAVTSSTMTVNGFSMRCVDFRASGIPGTSTICTTAQGILGYVKVASDPTSFEIKAYTTAPPAALFELPRGARVTTG
jgi:hypothetical protein